MKRQKLLTICACLILFSLALSNPTYSQQSSAKQPMGKIKGLILDQDDARVVDATIIIESIPKIGFKRSIISGQAGEFEIEGLLVFTTSQLKPLVFVGLRDGS